MADMVLRLRPELVKRLEDIARRENRPVDDVVETMLAQYGPPETNGSDEAPATLMLMLQMIESDQTVTWRGETDASERTKEILNNEFVDYSNTHANL
ncbi:MAG: hypothetical protein ACYDBJ_12905 [Aggregatilineales bacterium]